MAGVAYVDSSALVKLAVRERETSALEHAVLEYEGLITSRLAALECRRAAQRVASKRVRRAVEEAIDAVYLMEVTPAILELAARLDPPTLRSLDAIHLATAIAIDDPHLAVLTYDQRFNDAARANGLRVLRPGSRIGDSRAVG